jgi:hypothetical protein
MAIVEVVWFGGVPHHFGCCLLVSNDKLILLYAGTEVFSEG